MGVRKGPEKRHTTPPHTDLERNQELARLGHAGTLGADAQQLDNGLTQTIFEKLDKILCVCEG